jgi:hypothetical protein
MAKFKINPDICDIGIFTNGGSIDIRFTNGLIPTHDEIDYFISMLEWYKNTYSNDSLISYNKKILDNRAIEELEEMENEKIRAEKRYLDKVTNKKRKHTQGDIYIIKNPLTDLYKIGMSVDVDSRLADLKNLYNKNLSVVYTIPTNDMVVTEKLFHDLFSIYHDNYEWYRLSDNEIEWIKRGEYPDLINKSIKGEY